MADDFSISRAQREFERLRSEIWLRKTGPQPTTASDDTFCAVCKSIEDVLDAPYNLRAEKSLGTWSQFRTIDCSRHRNLFPVDASPSDLSQEFLLRKPARQYLLHVVPDLYRDAPGRAMLEAPWETVMPQEQDDEVSGSNDERAPRPRVVDSSQIDIQLLRTWLSTCRSTHRKKCGSAEFEDTSQARPALLIDVVNQCLVRSSTIASDYVALSYVWGRMNHFFTTTHNLERLLVPGSLRDFQDIPRTIREAIALTKRLGERFLWVDALCIVQNHKSKEQQLNSMASIFANACLTIVHADGHNADTGFRGLQDISTARKLSQKVITLSNTRQIVKPSSRQVWSGPMLTPWSTRAWTFQEEVCSRRVLYFAHQSVRWVCRTTTWSEESYAEDCMRVYGSAEQLQMSLDSPRLSKSPMPQLAEYEALVNGFNTRSLTFPEDALEAFAGVATRFGSKFPGGLICGLPELFFDLCLLWRPQHRQGPPLRRQTSKHGMKSSMLPSWSWAGWETEVAFPYTWNHTSAVVSPLPAWINDTRPFYQIEIHTYDRTSGTVGAVNNIWASYASSALSQGTPLPKGWTEHKADPSSSTHLVHYSTDPKCYTHVLDPSARFWFPVPLSETTRTPRSYALLHFKTTTGYFKTGARRRLTTALHAADDTIVGILWQHTEPDGACTNAAEAGTAIQLIAILGSTVPRESAHSMPSTFKDDIDSRTCAQLRPPVRVKKVYEAMWIEHDSESNVAYRKGTAQIDATVWESNMEGEPIDVLLG